MNNRAVRLGTREGVERRELQLGVTCAASARLFRNVADLVSNFSTVIILLAILRDLASARRDWNISRNLEATSR